MDEAQLCNFLDAIELSEAVCICHTSQGIDERKEENIEKPTCSSYAFTRWYGKEPAKDDRIQKKRESEWEVNIKRILEDVEERKWMEIVRKGEEENEKKKWKIIAENSKKSNKIFHAWCDSCRVNEKICKYCGRGLALKRCNNSYGKF